MVSMPRQYYNKVHTEKSFRLLQKLAGEVEFVLIGGWAVNYYVKQQNSLDIDIIIAPETLEYFKKYGIDNYGIDVMYTTIDAVRVDLFVQGISDKELLIPIPEIISSSARIGGVKVVKKEVLMLLKFGGYFSFDRTKTDKDIIDVVGLLFYGSIDLDEVKRYTDKYGIDERKGPVGMLEYLDKGEKYWDFITDSREEYQRLKEKAKADINKVFYNKG